MLVLPGGPDFGAGDFADVVKKLGLIDDVDGDLSVRVVPDDAGHAVDRVLTAAVAVDLAGSLDPRRRISGQPAK